MIRLALAALLLAAPAVADDQTTCLIAATRMIEAIADEAERRDTETARDISSPEARAVIASEQAKEMMDDPQACAFMAAAPDSFFIAMARRHAD